MEKAGQKNYPLVKEDVAPAAAGFRGSLNMRKFYIAGVFLLIFSIFFFLGKSFAGGKAGEIKKFDDIEMVFIPAGSFLMGSPESEKDRINIEGPQHRVSISAFWMGRFEVTQEQYRAVIGENPAKFKDNPRNPVEQVSWYDAVEYCNRLSEKQGLQKYYTIDKSRKDTLNINSDDDRKWTVTISGGNGFRLPTEAEWEYACRAGTTTIFCYGNRLDSTMANFCGENPYNAAKGEWRKKTTPAGSFKANAWGLYDMHGNVCEWCFDWFDEKFYTRSSAKDPVNLGGSEDRVMRDGTWASLGLNLRSAFRNGGWAGNRDDSNGFRVARSAF